MATNAKSFDPKVIAAKAASIKRFFAHANAAVRAGTARSIAVPGGQRKAQALRVK